MSVSGNVVGEVHGRSRPPGLRVVVCGGIGAGKSTVTAMLESHGAVAIEADRIGHEILLPGHPVAERVASRWPEVVVAGRIDRSKLGSLVFRDPEALAELESYTHPAIAAELGRRADALGDVPVVVEVPLVASWFGPEWWWIAVTADESMRLDRAVGRGAERDDAARRMAAQPGEDAYVEAADHVVVNDGGLEDLRRRVDEIWETLNAG